MNDQNSLEEIVRGVAGVRVRGRGDLAFVVVEREGLHGEICLQGAHVTSWIPGGNSEAIFVSRRSGWQAGKAIRGGVPICFPWFGPKDDDATAPQHGFARTRTWKLLSVADTEAGVVVEMEDRSDSETRKRWPHEFVIRHQVAFGEALTMKLFVKNVGAEAFTFEEAQHTYFRVGDAEKLEIRGLEGAEYLDKTENYARKKQEGPITVAGEIDLVYDSSSTVAIVDPVLRRQINITKSNSLSTVIWNPWIDRARALADFDDDEWKEMVCVETCNVRDRAIRLNPNDSHTMATEIRIKTHS